MNVCGHTMSLREIKKVAKNLASSTLKRMNAFTDSASLPFHEVHTKFVLFRFQAIQLAAFSI